MKIDDEFRSLIPALTVDELSGLEASIAAEGCREALLTWGGILLDGHNRYDICTRLRVKFSTREVPGISDRDEAKIWIIKNQFSRRNLSPMQRVDLVIKLEPLLAAQAQIRMKSGKANPVPNLAQGNDRRGRGKTRDVLSAMAGIGHTTLDAVKRIDASPVVELGRMTRAGTIPIYVADAVAKLPEKEQREAVAGGAEKIREAAAKKSTRGEKENHAKSKGMELAYDAIAILRKIPANDPCRNEAMATVIRWCRHNSRKDSLCQM